MTRIVGPLLQFPCSEEILMLEPKTHFERPSLEMVIKIVEAQIEQEATIEPDQGTKQRSLEGLFGAQAPAMARSSTFSQAEVWKQT
jgi:hypothetical protein